MKQLGVLVFLILAVSQHALSQQGDLPPGGGGGDGGINCTGSSGTVTLEASSQSITNFGVTTQYVWLTATHSGYTGSNWLGWNDLFYYKLHTSSTFISGSGTIAGLTPGVTYDFRVNSDRDCGLINSNVTQTVSASISFTVPVPVPVITTPDGTLLSYDNPSLQLQSQFTYDNSYTWYLNDNVIASTQSITVTQPGVYKLKGCGQNDCETSSIVQVTGETLYVNYVRTKTPLIEGITQTSQLDPLPYTQLNTSTTYSDGFARPVQDVSQAASPLGNDLVLLHKYDQLGRTAKQFLPYTRQRNDGAFLGIPSSFQPVFDFYQNADDKIADTSFPFAETRYDASPLSRVLQQGAQGEDWQLTTSHVKSVNYTSNVAADNVWIWAPSAQGLSASGFYPGGVLTVTESTDENGQLVRAFNDKANHTIVVEKVIEGGVKLRTYFVFDDFGMNTHVIPPKTVAALSVTPTATIASDVIARECFVFQYDERGRVISKSVPGGGSTYFIYDKWDRVVLTQNANQRSKNKWSFVKFDMRDRVILTGEINMTGDNVAATQTIANFYSTVSTNPSLRYEDAGGNIHGYTNRSFPILSNQFQAYSAAYFDDYGFLPQFGTGYQFVQESTLGLNANSVLTRTMMTGIKTIILGSQNYLKTVNYYDQKGRLIQIISDNNMGGFDRTSNAFDFTGRVTKIRTKHNGKQSVTIDKELTYDHRGRQLKTFHTINSGPKILLCDYHYNELGQLIEKNVHSTDGNKFLQSLDYAYNVRGWLSQVNPSETELNVIYPDQYGFGLSYQFRPVWGLSDFEPSFNGNIAAFTETRIGQDANPTIYSYHYDARNQLTRANYYQGSGNTVDTNSTKNGNYDMPSITYDQNGNPLTLKRKGITSGNIPGLIDDLQYSYSGNQLLQVSDNADKTKGFIKK